MTTHALPGQRGPAAQAAAPTLTINMDRYQADCAGRRLDLTRTEFDLLCILFREQHRILSREYLHSRLWSPGGANQRVVDTFISRLRTKLRAAGHPGIAVMRSRGYRLLQQDETSS